MRLKKFLPLILAVMMVFSFSSISSAFSQNADSCTSKTDTPVIIDNNIKLDANTPMQKEIKDNKTIIHMEDININGGSKRSDINSINSDTSVTKDVDENHPPIADLRYIVLNPATLTPEGYLTTNTLVAWVWSLDDTKFSYDPDGDELISAEVGGIPSSAILGDATQNNEKIGFVVQITTPGTYTMTFRCQDEHGVWSNIWSYAFYVASPPPPRIIDVECGNFHTVALKDDGTVWTWGWNDCGQLGDGTTSDSSTPVQVFGLGEVKAIACGVHNTYALKEDGTVWAWGNNGQGQLGDGTTTDSTIPVQVSGLSGVKALVKGGCGEHSLALKEDGTVWAWGYNFAGQVGDGTITNRTIPVQVATNVKAIYCGQYNSMAIKEDGTVWEWGKNSDGITSYTPVQVTSLSSVKAMGCGDISTAALKTDGNVWTWGSNTWWGLGYGSKSTKTYIPTRVTSISGVKDVLSSYFHTSALKTDGTIWTWGVDSGNQLPPVNATIKSTPTQITGFSGIASFASGTYHIVGLKSDGTLWAWGDNAYGQLGDGTTTNRSRPVQVIGLN